MGKGQEQSSRHLAQIVEPTDDEKAAAKAAWTFGSSFAHDSTALGVAAFALVFLIVLVIVIVYSIKVNAKNRDTLGKHAKRRATK